MKNCLYHTIGFDTYMTLRPFGLQRSFLRGKRTPPYLASHCFATYSKELSAVDVAGHASDSLFIVPRYSTNTYSFRKVSKLVQRYETALSNYIAFTGISAEYTPKKGQKGAISFHESSAE